MGSLGMAVRVGVSRHGSGDGAYLHFVGNTIVAGRLAMHPVSLELSGLQKVAARRASDWTSRHAVEQHESSSENS
eukprot:s3047_g6.t1